jgi:hypothetical protein
MKAKVKKPAAAAKRRKGITVKKITGQKRRRDGSSERVLLRSIKALQLKCAGASYYDIGKQLGVSRKQAWCDVQNLLAFHLDQSKDATEEFREMENQRLDLYLQKVVPNVVNATADSKGIVTMDDDFILAFNACLRISSLRIRLNGLEPARKAAVDREGEAVAPINLTKVTNFLTLIKRDNPQAYQAFVQATSPNGAVVKPKQIAIKGKKK